MLRFVFKSVLVLSIIPILVFALEPLSPQAMCDSILLTSNQKKCTELSKTEKFDWYAAGACRGLSDDELYLNCLKMVADKTINLGMIQLCESRESDQSRMKCILDAAHSVRTPADSGTSGKAPAGTFQPIR